MLRISPQPEKILDISQLSDLYSWPEKPWLRANMVQTLDPPSDLIDQDVIFPCLLNLKSV